MKKIKALHELLKKEKMFFVWLFYVTIFNCVPVTYCVYKWDIHKLLLDGTLYAYAISLLGPSMFDSLLEIYKNWRLEKKDMFLSAQLVLIGLGIVLFLFAICMYTEKETGEWQQYLVCFFAIGIAFMLYLFGQMDSYDEIKKAYGDKSYVEEEKERQAKIAKNVQEQKIKKDDEGCEL